MILYDLKCDQNHIFEIWFKDSAAYEKQKALGIVVCPYCQSTEVSKALMAPNIHTSKRRQKTQDIQKWAEENKDSEKKRPLDGISNMIDKIHKAVQENCDYVGKQFAEEARKIHYSETRARNIYGETSLEEAKLLIEEGISVLPLPHKTKTNT